MSEKLHTPPAMSYGELPGPRNPAGRAEAAIGPARRAAVHRHPPDQGAVAEGVIHEFGRRPRADPPRTTWSRPTRRSPGSRASSDHDLSWDVLATMTPADYLSFRAHLGTSSGFQSFQFRTLEYLLGVKDAASCASMSGRRSRPAEGGAGRRPASTTRRSGGWRGGFAIPDEVLDREAAALRLASGGGGRLDEVYRDPTHTGSSTNWPRSWSTWSIRFLQWRLTHVQTVERIIGFSPEPAAARGGLTWPRRWKARSSPSSSKSARFSRSERDSRKWMPVSAPVTLEKRALGGRLPGRLQRDVGRAGRDRGLRQAGQLVGEAVVDVAVVGLVGADHQRPRRAGSRRRAGSSSAWRSPARARSRERPSSISAR